MYAIPNEDKWTIILNSKLDTWGAYSYDESLDIARVDVPVQKTDSLVEAFSITFDTQNNESKMFMAWEDVQVGVPIIH